MRWCPGERGILLCVALDQRVAKIILDYAEACFERSPILKQLIVNRTADALELANGITLEVRPASFRKLRGPTYIAVVADMGALDCCSEIRLGLLRRLASTTVQAEMLEARMVNGEAIDIATLCTLASTTVRLSQRLGLERRARNVTPSLGQYLAARTAPANGDANSIDADGTE